MIGINGQPLRRVRPAVVIRTVAVDDAPERPTTEIRYTRDDATSAWYAEYRRAQAVRGC